MADYSKYEKLKRDWIKENPNASPQQYTDAMRVLAKKAGV